MCEEVCLGVGKVVGKCVRMWGSVLGCGSGEKRCGEVWGRHGKPNTSHKIFSQLPHLP